MTKKKSSSSGKANPKKAEKKNTKVKIFSFLMKGLECLATILKVIDLVVKLFS